MTVAPMTCGNFILWPYEITVYVVYMVMCAVYIGRSDCRQGAASTIAKNVIGFGYTVQRSWHQLSLALFIKNHSD